MFVVVRCHAIASHLAQRPMARTESVTDQQTLLKERIPRACAWLFTTRSLVDDLGIILEFDQVSSSKKGI